MSSFTTALSSLRGIKATPARVLIGGAGLVIMIGTLLLSLPQAAAEGTYIGFVDALFTATSAVCVTGLVVLDTPVAFSSFGHVVLMVLFQIGGLGYMTAATFVALVLGKRLGLRNRLVLKEAMASPTMEGLMRFAALTVKITLWVELLVAVILATRFMADMPLGKAMWYGLFHAVSAFNNAGFALFSDSLMSYADDPVVVWSVLIAVVIGSLGFLVLSDASRMLRQEVRSFSLHSRLTLTMTVLVGLSGAVVLFILEAKTVAMGVHGLVSRIDAALFQAVASRTAGFATIDIGALSAAGLFMLILLMMVGGGSGSCAGGIKLSTFGVVLASLWSTLRGREQVHVFYRTIPLSIVQKSFFLSFMAFFMATGMTWLVLVIEGTEFLPTLFEVASAVGTVGLSVGDGAGRSFCAGFSDTGKLLIAGCMFIGRLGPLTIGIAVLQSESQQRFKRPQERVLIG